jgi:pilus assembly protein CpaB
MIGRRILMVLGLVALVAGVILTVVWLRTPGPSHQQRAAAEPDRQAVLALARPVKARSLLRVDDLTWRMLPPQDVPLGAYVRSAAPLSDYAGAVVRRNMVPGDIVRAEDIVKPKESGFLAAVLGKGMRAVAIPVGPTEGGAGLIVPGDRVDVVLTQIFADAPRPSQRSVGETVMRDLRVIATDQSVVADLKRALGPNEAIARTVTLEATQPQAEALMVAMQLGKLQLTLRNADETTSSGSWIGEPVPTWGSTVSPALREMERGASGSGAAQEAPAKPGLRIEILRGGVIELRCFDEAGGPLPDCGRPRPAPPAPAPAPPPQDGAPARPGNTRQGDHG